MAAGSCWSFYCWLAKCRKGNSVKIISTINDVALRSERGSLPSTFSPAACGTGSDLAFRPPQRGTTPDPTPGLRRGPRRTGAVRLVLSRYGVSSRGREVSSLVRGQRRLGAWLWEATHVCVRLCVSRDYCMLTCIRWRIVGQEMAVLLEK